MELMRDVIGVAEIEFIKKAVQCVREWRDFVLSEMHGIGMSDLSFRSETGIPALGWILGHQAASYDFSLNLLIKGEPPKNPRMFELHKPGTSGDWNNVPLEELEEYYDTCEQDFLEWIENATEHDMERTIQEGSAPEFFVGRTIREVIATMFTHLNYHTGHLAAMRTECREKQHDQSDH